MKLLTRQLLTTFFLLFVLFAGPITLVQAEDIQTVVISLQADPLTDQEPACVALQLGKGLLKAKDKENNPLANVTIFATLDGVGIANTAVMESRKLTQGRSKFCEIVNKQGQLQDPKPLPTVLDEFLAEGGEILACPLCWVARYGDLPDSAEYLIQYNDQVYIDTPVPLFLEADKVIDY